MRVFLISTTLLVLIATAFVFQPSAPVNNLAKLILVLDRSSQLLRCGMLFFLWVYSTRLGILWRHHVFGIVFGLGMYSGVGLIAATADAAIGKTCGYWLAPIPGLIYFAATLIWPIYFLRNEPARGPLTTEDLDSYRGLITLAERATNEVRRAMRDRL